MTGAACAALTALQVFVSGGYYSFGVDVWSLACIMAELMRCVCIACDSDRHEVISGAALPSNVFTPHFPNKNLYQVVNTVALFHETSAPDLQSTKCGAPPPQQSPQQQLISTASTHPRHARASRCAFS